VSAIDLAVVAGRVHTADGTHADTVAVTGDRIVAVGLERDIRSEYTASDVLHLPGRLVVPGFGDAHVHAPFAGRYAINVALHDIHSLDGYLSHIAAFARANADKPVIYGGGWAMEHFAGGLPTKDLLDSVVPDRPVFLYNRDIHGAWVNSKALDVARIDANTSDPGDGRYERYPDGDPTGLLHEGAAYSFERRFVPAPDRAEWERAILHAQSHLHTLGITSWQDAWVTPDTLAAYRSLADAGTLTARVVAALWWDRHRDRSQIDDLLTQREWATGGNLRATSVKIMTDGIIENGSAAMLEPYLDGCGGHTSNTGHTYLDRDQLADAVTVLDNHGFQVHMHAIGDRAVRNALDACEVAQVRNGRRDARHHIAHVQVVHPADVPRFGSLGVVVNGQPYWAKAEPQMEEHTIPYLGAARAAGQYPFASMLAAGARLAFGSDWSVSTPDPLVEMEVAVTRVDPDHRDRPPLHPHEAITLAQAFEAFTRGTAHVNFMEDAGVVAAGYRADLAVIDADIFTGDTPRPADASVGLTIAGGEVVFGG
jgi:predicted amidohydrolase YtcJ